MAAIMKEVEVWVMVDEEGNYVATTSSDELSEAYDSHEDSDANLGSRVIKITLKVPLPTPIEITATVLADSNLAACVVVE